MTMPLRRPTSPARRNGRRITKPDRRRALELLAGSPQEGCTDVIMIAHGFTVDQMVELVREGLVSATAQRVKAGRERMEVATLRLTESGRKALGEQ
jgi:hypothetical protein